jgi:hypothetical protein
LGNKKVGVEVFLGDSFPINGVHLKLANFKDDCKWLSNGRMHNKLKKGINQCWYFLF